jgi:hypothetical protein
MLGFTIFLFSLGVFARSVVVPEVKLAAMLFRQGVTSTSGMASPDVVALLSIFEKNHIEPVDLQHLDAKNELVKLAPVDVFDLWADSNSTERSVPLLFQASKLQVIDPSDDVLKDNIYTYFFVTESVTTTAKVTGIYKGIGRNQGFSFNLLDRQIFPLSLNRPQRVSQHLIIDYGIVESDGDDIKKLQKLSAAILDLAVTVYSLRYPEQSGAWANLRREVKTLSEYLLELDDDDRLVNSSFGFKAHELNDKLKHTTVWEFERKHKNSSWFNRWEYRIRFRVLKE